MGIMRGSKNFHERGFNENGNFWSQTRGGGGNPELTFFKVKFSNSRGGGADPLSPLLDPRMGIYIYNYGYYKLMDSN